MSIAATTKILSSFMGSFAGRHATKEYSPLMMKLVSDPHEHVLHVELNRPDTRNAIHRDMFREIGACFNEIAADQQCRAVVISGAGKMFCSGIDSQDLMAMISATSENMPIRDDVASRAKSIRSSIVMLQNSFLSILKCPKPVIAAVHSGCIGAGIDLITATDIRYASKDAYFSVREVMVGLAADLGTLQRLPKIIGNDSHARELSFTGRDMPADEAKEIGLLSRVFDDPESCKKGALEIAQMIASRSPVAVQGTKVSMNYSRDHSERDGLEFMQIWNMCMAQSEDLVMAAMSKSNEPPQYNDF